MNPKTKEAAYWINERERIRKLKEDGHAPPYTKDNILATFRFCNVHREDDKVTRWIRKTWREPFQASSLLPRALTLARLVNWPPTLTRIGYPEPWVEENILRVIREFSRNHKAWSSAYIVSTNGLAVEKASYVVGTVAAGIPPRDPTAGAPWESLEQAWTWLKGRHGLGSFMAAQIVADLKHVPNHALSDAPDWYTWAAPGPGSLRGLRRYFNRGITPGNFLQYLEQFADEVAPYVNKEITPIAAQDWQNICCELDKYWRVKEGQGRPRAYYTPSPEFA